MISKFSRIFDQSGKCDLVRYIDMYLEYVLEDQDDTADKPELLPRIPPNDKVWEMYDMGNCEEKTVCFWTMRLIKFSCIALFRHNKIIDGKADWRQCDIGDSIKETYEDLYYDTLLHLFLAYSASPHSYL